MKATLALEYLGEGNDARCRLMVGIVRESLGEAAGSLLDFPSRKPWVAEIIAGKRRFLRANWQRKNANSEHTRGVFLWFLLESGHLYEVCHYTSWRSKDRYFCEVTDDGDIIRLSPTKAKQCQSAA